MSLKSSSISRVLLILSPVFLLVFLVACNEAAPQSTFDAKGPVARDQLNLFLLVLWVAVVVFVLVEGALIYTLVRFRRRASDALPKEVHGNTRLEIAWTIVPALLLAVLAVPTIITQFRVSKDPGPDALTVQVTGHQWWWQFDYPEIGVVTANEMHVPVGQDVRVLLKSQDVIHSFWIPKLAGKVDVIPNRNNQLWFRADEEGVYLGQCAELCGIAHGWMRFQVIAQSQEEFQQWVYDQKTPALTPLTPEAQQGAKLFLSKGCVACHTISGTIAMGLRGPNLTHLASRSTLAAGIMGNSPEDLREWLTDPEAVKPGNVMAREAAVYTGVIPSLTAKEIDELVSYLSSLE